MLGVRPSRRYMIRFPLQVRLKADTTPGLTVSDSWKVHKFGGSSVADAACMARVASILEADPAPSLAVVLSAARGVTDALLDLIASPVSDDTSYDSARSAANRIFITCN